MRLIGNECDIAFHPHLGEKMALRIIKTNVETGTIVSVKELQFDDRILEVFEDACREDYSTYLRVTLWDDFCNKSMGDRVVNVPFGGYAEKLVTEWARNNLMEFIHNRQKIQAIKKLRERFPNLRLKESKDVVESITPSWV